MSISLEHSQSDKNMNNAKYCNEYSCYQIFDGEFFYSHGHFLKIEVDERVGVEFTTMSTELTKTKSMRLLLARLKIGVAKKSQFTLSVSQGFANICEISSDG